MIAGLCLKEFEISARFSEVGRYLTLSENQNSELFAEFPLNFPQM
jgi:hypothetical protein